MLKFCLLLLLWLPIQAQDTLPSVSTSLTGPRFEVIQSPITTQLTLRLDKYLGYTKVRVQDSNGELGWETVVLEHRPYDTEASVNRINYQILMSGRTVRDTFLTNVNTGQTWQITEDSRTHQMFWQLIE